MTQSTAERNPFMLMISPEVVFAAIEKSEHLGQLNRHLCRPLDRITPATLQIAADAANDDVEVDGEDGEDGDHDDVSEPLTA